MKKSTPAQWAIRIGIYIIGLFCLALGVAFAVNSNLGVSPVTSLPYVVSLISGTALSTCVILVYGSYILLQVLILRKEFRIINLTQIIFSAIFGYFTDFTKWLLGDFTLPTYAGQLAMLAISIVVVALGVFLYIEVDLVPMPIGLLAVPLSMVVGSDSLYMIMAPIFGSMVETFGGTMMSAAAATTIGACIAVNLCMVAPTPYLALGLCGVEMKENLKYMFIPTWILSIVMVIAAGITGAVPF